MYYRRKNKGILLVEILASIVIISLAITGLSLAFYQVANQYKKPEIVPQSLLIAKSYLAEIMSKQYPAGFSCAVVPASSKNRSDYINICDYHGLIDNGAKDAFGNLLPGLSDYKISVNIDIDGVDFGGLSSGGEVLQINVKVDHVNNFSTVISAYKTKY